MGSKVRAIVQLRLAPWLMSDVFEQWLHAVPAVEWAALSTDGGADYELQVQCRSIADLGDALTRIRCCRGVEVKSSALLLHDVTGLVPQRRDVSDEVTVPRLQMM